MGGGGRGGVAFLRGRDSLGNFFGASFWDHQDGGPARPAHLVDWSTMEIGDSGA
jgi:hypothetical protein